MEQGEYKLFGRIDPEQSEGSQQQQGLLIEIAAPLAWLGARNDKFFH